MSTGKPMPRKPKYHEWWVETVLAFAESGMNAAKAARTMYITRNALLYRLDVIYDRTGLQPLKFDDLVVLVGQARNIKDFGIVQLNESDTNNIPTHDAYLAVKSLLNRIGYKLILEQK